MYENLEIEMLKSKITKRQISEELSFNYGTLLSRFKGDTDWSRSEMFSIQERYFPEKTINYLFKKF